VDGSNFKIGNNEFIVQKNNIQTPSYIELNNFTPKTVGVKTVDK
jgi:hypothetical protein